MEQPISCFISAYLALKIVYDIGPSFCFIYKTTNMITLAIILSLSLYVGAFYSTTISQDLNRSSCNDDASLELDL